MSASAADRLVPVSPFLFYCPHGSPTRWSGRSALRLISPPPPTPSPPTSNKLMVFEDIKKVITHLMYAMRRFIGSKFIIFQTYGAFDRSTSPEGCIRSCSNCGLRHSVSPTAVRSSGFSFYDGKCVLELSSSKQ